MLYQHIVAAVNAFPAGAQRQRYATAALSWRTPYWDWAAPPAAGQSVYPSSLSSPNVTVTTPNGTTTIRNPLHSYRFHPVSASEFYFNPVSVSHSRQTDTNTNSAFSLRRGMRHCDIPQTGLLQPGDKMRL